MWTAKARNKPTMWGISSVGRASALHAEGQEFESPILHHKKQDKQLSCFLLYKVFRP